MFIPYANNTDTDKLADSSRKANLIASFWKNVRELIPGAGGGRFCHFFFIFEILQRKDIPILYIYLKKDLKIHRNEPKN